ncbi:LysM peptidoglycan-binding domain-containing protein [Bacillus altitudinis]|jgi:3D (Asp-Asp-Asp) domain-containing protein/LysM repeat protein|uniref:Exported cell wall lytic enzyme n=2 Tax=Bacillus TaxID=1386 RepID=A0A5K1NBH1_BACAB|nr:MULTISPECIES: 3D domain-containing protein [Bacillus]EMI11947.1 exported cell wall-binding protein [Bacillus stratosphericus LAMA 585]KML13947.1 peptidoglycan-binding protein [Bacillus stratosphericus]KQL39776.1 peptidoglycan-binding protein [Bacillus sp. FJAT-21955]MBW3702207.1 LysM peptidoglycan-binding domain-containing protein [Bacillus aerophilus]MDH8710631.1 3D (Asp-Asp-Asp) domain-containing protein/LysM repeat protein [Micromonospora sp. 1209]CVM09777.1 Cell wall-binding protein yo
MKKTIMSLVAVAAISTTALGAQQASAKEITVQKGDTLWGISQKNDVSLKDLKGWNNLSTDMIYVGDKLTISSKEKTQEQYKVQKGDSLWKIAQKFNVSISDIKSWNNLNSDIIMIGSTLSVAGQSSAPVSSEPVQKQAPVQKEQTTKKAAPKKETAKAESSSASQSVQKEMTVTATAYTANDGGISGITATGVNLNKNPNAKVIAVDPNVIPLGSKVYVEGYGEAIAADTGGAIKGNKIDVHVPSKSQAKNWGVKSVKVKVLN